MEQCYSQAGSIRQEPTKRFGSRVELAHGPLSKLALAAKRLEFTHRLLFEPSRAAKRLESTHRLLFEPPRAAKRLVAKRIELARACSTLGLKGSSPLSSCTTLEWNMSFKIIYQLIHSADIILKNQFEKDLNLS